MISQQGTDGRVYGGDCNLVHIADGQRRRLGQGIANEVSLIIRNEAAARYATPEGKLKAYTNPLCPGCYMIALFNAAITLADENGQSREELGRTMALAFAKIADRPFEGLTEEIEVILDKD